CGLGRSRSIIPAAVGCIRILRSLSTNFRTAAELRSVLATWIADEFCQDDEHGFSQQPKHPEGKRHAFRRLDFDMLTLIDGGNSVTAGGFVICGRPDHEWKCEYAKRPWRDPSDQISAAATRCASGGWRRRSK